MKVKIEMLPNKTSDINFAKEVKDIAKDLIETCARYRVTNLTYNHDYFKIHIEQPVNPFLLLEDNEEKLTDCKYGCCDCIYENSDMCDKCVNSDQYDDENK